MFIVATRDPDRLVTVLAAITGAAVTAGALVAAAFAAATRGRGRARSVGMVRAVRRGAIAGAIVGLVAVLRVIDGLTPLTAAFVVGAFVLAEVVLSARAT